jgi:hypothetical protein
MPEFNEKELAMGADDKLSAPPDFKGPTSERSVTDPFCSFLLIGKEEVKCKVCLLCCARPNTEHCYVSAGQATPHWHDASLA